MSVNRQAGGMLDIQGRLGKAGVQQPENARDSATLTYNEDGVKIPMGDGDELEVIVDKGVLGGVRKTIMYKPKNKSNVEVSNITADGTTGTSHKDMVGQLKVFMKSAKIILWVGIGFLVSGGVFAGFLRDTRTGMILGGIGALMLIGFAVLPQIYANYLLVLGILSIVIPVMWYLNMRRNERLLKASVETHEELKIKDPEKAKEQSNEFKQKIDPKDLDHVKKLKNVN